MDKKIIIIFAFLLVVPLINAATDTQDVTDVFKLNEIINYAKPCINNGTYCSTTSSCNLTVLNPDNSILINDTMTNWGIHHNITFAVTNIGVYKADMICEDGGLTGAETYYFEVTGSGFNNTLGFYAIILSLSFGVIVLGFWMQDAIITIFGSFGLYFFALYILFNGITGIKDTFITYGLGIIVLGIAMYISTRATHELITG